MRVVHCRIEPYTHYIGRPSPFGNPFRLQSESQRPRLLERYRAYTLEHPALLEAIYRLPPDAILGCWCAPRPCHGGVIIDLWRWLHNLEK